MRSFDRIKTLWPGLFGMLCAALVVAPAATAVHAQDSVTRNQKATHYSLYYENFKQENFESARSDLMWILENAPGYPGGDDRNYERAVDLYKGLAEAAGDSDKAAYLDTAATYLTTAESKMDQQGLSYNPYYWELEKGRFIQTFGDSLSGEYEGLRSALAHYEKAFNLAPTEIDPYYVNYIIQEHLRQNKQQEALAFMNAVAEKRGDDDQVMKLVEQARQKIFGRNPQARIAYLEEQMEAHPDSSKIVSELFQAYTQQGNVQGASKLADRLMETNPSADIVRDIAQMRLEDGRPKEAYATYQKALDQGAELQAEDYFNMGLAQQRMGSLPQARQYYRQAIDKRSDFGRAYIAIGDLYANAVSQCSGGEMARNDKAVYWAAVDKYRQAMEVDPSVKSTANSKINTYRKYFPTQEDIFYKSSWESGGTITIDFGCYSWIGETTRVRQSPSS
jgi:tetratricopeptide (TPR) repeat protein